MSYWKDRKARLEAKGLCGACGRKPPLPDRTRCEDCLEINAAAGSKHRKTTYYKLKEEVFQKLGAACRQCGCNDKRFLEIDHINGDGSKEKRLTAIALFKAVLADDGTRYQLLCPYCHAVKTYFEFQNGQYRRTGIRAASSDGDSSVGDSEPLGPTEKQ